MKLIVVKQATNSDDAIVAASQSTQLPYSMSLLQIKVSTFNLNRILDNLMRKVNKKKNSHKKFCVGIFNFYSYTFTIP